MRGPGAPERQRRVIDLPWTILRQVHGDRVIEVDRPGSGFGEEADALVTRKRGAVLAVLSADCAPVVFSSAEGVIGAAHAGWPGAEAGVIEATVAAMRRLGATVVEATIGPCIHPCCYPFGAADLTRLADRWGPMVRSTDRDGRPALDLPAAVRQALQSAGAVLTNDSGPCTACSAEHWSWRARQNHQRQAAAIWQ